MEAKASAPRGFDKRLLTLALGALLLIPLVLLATRDSELDAYIVCGRWSKKWVVLCAGLLWVAAGAAAAATRSRRKLFGFVLGTMMLGAAWLALEVAGLAGVVDYGRAFGTAMDHTIGGAGKEPEPHVDQKGVAPGNIAYQWRIPNEPYPYHLRTDHRGYRNAEDRDAADIYLVGDSFVYAGLVPWEETTGAVLEATLGRPALNIALIGQSPAVASEQLFAAGFPFEGSLVVQFLYEGNDLRDTRWDREAEASAPTASLADRSFLVNALALLALLTRPEGVHPGLPWRGTWQGETYYFLDVDGWSEELDPEVERIVQTLVQTKQRVEEAGGTYVTALFPAKLRVYAPYCEFPPDGRLAGVGDDVDGFLGPVPSRFEQACAAAGVSFLDLTPAYQRALERGEAVYFTDDTHLNGAGQRVTAEALLGWEPVKAWLSKTGN